MGPPEAAGLRPALVVDALRVDADRSGALTGRASASCVSWRRAEDEVRSGNRYRLVAAWKGAPGLGPLGLRAEVPHGERLARAPT